MVSSTAGEDDMCTSGYKTGSNCQYDRGKSAIRRQPEEEKQKSTTSVMVKPPVTSVQAVTPKSLTSTVTMWTKHREGLGANIFLV